MTVDLGTPAMGDSSERRGDAVVWSWRTMDTVF